MTDIPETHIEQHWQSLMALSEPGQVLAADSPYATVKNPKWYGSRGPTAERRQLHDQILADFLAEKPDVGHDRIAVIMAGPPGAGKTTIRKQVLDQIGATEDHFHIIDADNFKDALLQHAIDDGTYETDIKPPEVKQLETQGELFYPRELASLVHEESSDLARRARKDAMVSGENFVLDGVLSNPDKAVQLGQDLAAAHYRVHVVDVEVSEAQSRAAVARRWREGRIAAAQGIDTLGGRIVPNTVLTPLFHTMKQTTMPHEASQQLATTGPTIESFWRWRRPEQDWDHPILETSMTRATPDSDLAPRKPPMPTVTSTVHPPTPDTLQRPRQRPTTPANRARGR